MSPAQEQLLDLVTQLPWPPLVAGAASVLLGLAAWRRRKRQEAGQGLSWKEFLLRASTEWRLHRYSRLVDSAENALEALRIELGASPPTSETSDEQAADP